MIVNTIEDYNCGSLVIQKKRLKLRGPFKEEEEEEEEKKERLWIAQGTSRLTRGRAMEPSDHDLATPQHSPRPRKAWRLPTTAFYSIYMVGCQAGLKTQLP